MDENSLSNSQMYGTVLSTIPDNPILPAWVHDGVYEKELVISLSQCGLGPNMCVKHFDRKSAYISKWHACAQYFCVAVTTPLTAVHISPTGEPALQCWYRVRAKAEKYSQSLGSGCSERQHDFMCHGSPGKDTRVFWLLTEAADKLWPRPC